MNGLAHAAQSSSTLGSLPLNGLTHQTTPPKGYHGDRTSDYGSMSSYAVTSPKSQPSVIGTMDRDYGIAAHTPHLNHVVSTSTSLITGTQGLHMSINHQPALFQFYINKQQLY